MVLDFIENHGKLICTTPDASGSGEVVKFVKCNFTVTSKRWTQMDSLIAVFKSASYSNSGSVALDSAGSCYMPVEVFKHMGVVKVVLQGYKRNYPRIAEDVYYTGPCNVFLGTEPAEPVDIPSTLEVLIAEYTELYNYINEMVHSPEFKGEKGDKGDQGDPGPKGDTGEQGPVGATGATGATGPDGYSPSATVTKSGRVATISITDKNGTTSATVSDGADGNVTDVKVAGTSVVTSGTANIPSANSTNYGVIKTTPITDNNSQMLRIVADDIDLEVPTLDMIQKMSYKNLPTATSSQRGAVKVSKLSDPVNAKLTIVSGSNYYTDNVTADVPVIESGLIRATYLPEATTSAKGAMSTTDKTKLDGIDSGAQVNVQSDWNESDSTDDAYIANKPSIHNVPSGGTSGQVLAKVSGTDYDLSWVTPSSGANIPYYTCSALSSAMMKKLVAVSSPLDAITTGCSILVKFTNGNAVQQPFLSFPDETWIEREIRAGSSSFTATSNPWGAGEIVMLTYDGNYWQLNDWSVGDVRIDGSSVVASNGIATIPKAAYNQFGVVEVTANTEPPAGVLSVTNDVGTFYAPLTIYDEQTSSFGPIRSRFLPYATLSNQGAVRMSNATGSPVEDEIRLYYGSNSSDYYAAPNVNNQNGVINRAYLPDATTSTKGAMSAADKTKLDGISNGANATSVTQVVSSGTKIATIDIDGTDTDIYAPGSSYTATSPIDITSDVISHEDSGVTAGTYDGGPVKFSGFYVPSITVDAKGHVTSATDLGTLLPLVTGSSRSWEFGNIISAYAWRNVARLSTSSYYVLSAGNTSASFTLSDPYCAYGDSYNIQLLNVEAIDSSGAPVIVDWDVDYATATGGKVSSITLTVSIAEAYDKNIIIKPIVAYGYVGM